MIWRDHCGSFQWEERTGCSEACSLIPSDLETTVTGWLCGGSNLANTACFLSGE